MCSNSQNCIRIILILHSFDLTVSYSLQIGDQMLCFGSVNYKNFNGDLRNVAKVAQHSQNQNVRIQVIRNGQVC